MYHHPKKGLTMTPRHVLSTLSNRLGVTLPARSRAFAGVGASIAVLALGLAATPALANSGYALTKAIGAKGPGAGQMELAPNSGVAVNDATHDVYVADTGNRRVDVFNDEGAFQFAFGKEVEPLLKGDVCTSLTGCQKGASGHEPGEFEAPTSVAVDNATGGGGDVYVADTGAGVIQKFTAEGVLIESWGVKGQLDQAPAPTVIGELVAGSNVVSLTSGNFLGEFFGGEEVIGAGIPAGARIVNCPSNTSCELSKAAEVTATGVSITAAPQGFGRLGISGIAVAPTAGELLLYSEGPGKHLLEFERNGGFVQGSPTAGFGPGGSIALDGAGDVYLSSNGGVIKLTPKGEPLPGGAAGDATGLTANQASNDLYVDRGSSIEDFGPSGNAITTFSSGQLEAGGGAGLAADSGNGTVYAANATADQLEAFGVAIVVDTKPPAEQKGTSVTFEGEVNPEGGKVSECKFEYVSEQSEGGFGTPGAQTAACEPSAIGEGTSLVPVSAKIAGLTGGTKYEVRLLATHENARGEQTSVAGATELFTTSTVPVITNPEAANLTATGAELRADVNPENLQVHRCVFEYGTGTSYGQSAPCKDPDAAEIGAGTTPVPVSAQIEGLAANATYHWRLDVTDKNGETVSQDHTFIYPTAGAELPDDRAYEMVSPPFKNGALLGRVFFGTVPDVAESGSRVIARSIQCFEPAESCTALRASSGEPFAFTRGTNGWVATSLAPPATQFSENTAWQYNANLGTALFSMPTGPAGEDEWYKREGEENGEKGAFLPFGPATRPGETGLGQIVATPPVYTTANLSRIVLNVVQGEARAFWPGDQTSGGTGASSIYEYAGTGEREPFLVGVKNAGPPPWKAGATHLNEGAELISDCTTYVGSTFAAEAGAGWNPLSADGRTVYFTAKGHDAGEAYCPASKQAPPVSELYARVDGEAPDAHTIAISEPSPAEDPGCTGACLANIGSSHEAQFRNANFAGASNDGSIAFFLDPQQLTDAAPQGSGSANGAACSENGSECNLYESLCAEDCQRAGETRTVVDASQGAEGTPVPGGARVQGVVGTSADGSHVYFVANGVLTRAANDQGGKAVSGDCGPRLSEYESKGTCNLYVYERDERHPAGHLAFVASVPGLDLANWKEEGTRFANVTPDGRFLVFESSGRLTPDDTRSNGVQQIFRYDAQSEQLVRISIGNDGFNDNGNQGVPGVDEGLVGGSDSGTTRFYTGGPVIVPAFFAHSSPGPARGNPTMSDDGEYVFFSSPAALTPHALNDVVIASEKKPDGEISTDYAENIYEYHDGHVYLISDGHDTSTAQTPCGPRGGQSSTCLLGSDAAGHNVFFMTADQLVPQDTDTQVDIYDARICEPETGNPCIAEPSPPLPPCLGEACHGIPATTPSLLAPGSASFNGEGNIKPAAPAPAVKPKALTRTQKLAAALKACHKEKKKAKRQGCEKQANKNYGHVKAKKSSAKKSSDNRRAK
jgi:hypothetical protein